MKVTNVKVKWKVPKRFQQGASRSDRSKKSYESSPRFVDRDVISDKTCSGSIWTQVLDHGPLVTRASLGSISNRTTFTVRVSFLTESLGDFQLPTSLFFSFVARLFGRGVFVSSYKEESEMLQDPQKLFVLFLVKRRQDLNSMRTSSGGPLLYLVGYDWDPSHSPFLQNIFLSRPRSTTSPHRHWRARHILAGCTVENVSLRSIGPRPSEA